MARSGGDADRLMLFVVYKQLSGGVSDYAVHMGSDSPRTLKTVETTIEVVRALQRLDGAGVTEVAEHLDISKGAAYNHLATLTENRLVVNSGDTYRLSLHVATRGEYVRQNDPLYQAGWREIDRVAAETGEYVHLTAVEYGHGIHLYQGQGERAVGQEYHEVNTTRPDHLHYTATGKAVLAHLPRERVEWIIDEHGLPAMTEHTITDRATLFEDLEAIRARGYSINDEEEIKGLRAVGAPIRDTDGAVVGGISVSGPVSRFTEAAIESDFANVVTQAANVIQLNMGEFERGQQTKRSHYRD